MAQQHRYSQGRSHGGERGSHYDRDWDRGDPHRSSSERDRYQAGDERRFNADWDGDRGNDRAFEGDSSYAAGGYAEEIGYRRDRGSDYERSGGYPYPGSGPSWASGSQRPRSSSTGRSGGLYRDFQSHWDRTRDGDESYYGTGHQGGAFGTAAGTRASGGDNFYGPSEEGEDFYGRRSYGAPESDWRLQGHRGGSSPRNYRGDQSRWSGGNFQTQGSSYGTQSGYGRNAQSFGARDYENQGYSAQQSFRGRGPKGYQRTDDRLKEIICEQLMEDPDIDASEVNVEVSGAVVTLTGTIEDRRTKYEIEDIIERIGGVRDINNQLRVESSSRWQSSSQSNAAASTSQGSTPRGADRPTGNASIGGSNQSSGGQGSSGWTGSPSKKN